ncbi:MAG TPA: LD-carboxypeptidase [Allosphingosinicella sp.]|nr:LD-carboxypeptidase [Allosphingosinicella sp.]
MASLIASPYWEAPAFSNRLETKQMRIAVVAPSARMSEEAARRVCEVAAQLHPEVEVHFHPQCFLSHNHFAGTDAERVAALVETANDPAFDAIWFARGGYGACRVAEAALARLGPAARDKAWLGYSDAGFLLAGLCKAGIPDIAHGPMANDVMRDGGEAAVARALAWLVRRDADALEPGLALGDSHAAFNMTVFSLLLGTPLEPDLTGRVLLLEEVSEHMYRVDRSLFHITGQETVRRIAGIRLGRVSEVPANDPDFGEDEDRLARFWCARAGIAYLGRADIGHDSANKVVPFGRF